MTLLRGAMAERGMSQGDLARLIGVSRSTINKRLKTGNFTVGEVLDITRVLGLTPRQATSVFLNSSVIIRSMAK